MESFFNYKKPEVYFELNEEENYYVSMYDFLEYVTSDAFTSEQGLLNENISENIIYNFEINQDKISPTFKNSNEIIYIIKGVSIIRREEELTLSIVAGKKRTENDIIDKEDYKLDKSPYPHKLDIYQSAKSSLEENDLEFEYLDLEKEFIKTIISIRLDLETLTIDTIYVAEETNLMFNITTNDKTIYTKQNGEFINDAYEKTYNENIHKLSKYDAILDLINYLVYLPLYFNNFEDNIQVEELETEYKNLVKNPLKKRKFQNTIGHKATVKSLYYLDKKNNLAPDKIILRDDLFKVQKSGFWKTLNPEQVGLDKKGNTIHGKTWVSQNSSWFEADSEDLTVESNHENFDGPNAGFIYILRNPIMGNNIFKIGLTRNNVDYRAEQLSKTSVPDRFYKVQEWYVKDCVDAEKKIHEILNDYRVDPRREFFEVNYDKAVAVIVQVVESLNKNMS